MRTAKASAAPFLGPDLGLQREKSVHVSTIFDKANVAVREIKHNVARRPSYALRHNFQGFPPTEFWAPGSRKIPLQARQVTSRAP